MNPPRPDNIFVGRPIYHGSTPLHDVGMLEIAYDRAFAGAYDQVGESDVSTARDYVVHKFLQSGLEWLAWIDSDIGFRRSDWALLMEQQGDELAVCGEYLKKTQDPRRMEIANFGLGFARVHRSVYELLDDLNTEHGEARLHRYRRMDQESSVLEDFVEYHPVGVAFDGSRRNEDHGFWLLVALAAIPTRKESRTRLGHTGPFTWWYRPELIQQKRDEEAGAQ
jgi:hypothetical protein